jgi:HKD family nuclease
MGNIAYENHMQGIKEKGVIHRSNCITGDNDHLIYRLREAFKKAKSIDIIVAFLMESGVKLLKDDLKEAMARGVKIRILTVNYLNITQPQALYLLRDILGDEVDIRFYNVPNKSFHPKAYIFHFEETQGEIYVGSSNISNSALTSGIEWNYRLDKKSNLEDFNHFYNTFEDLFLNQSIIVDEDEMKRYLERWVRPRLYNIMVFLMIQ